MASQNAGIDTSAPFASVRDAVSMFGDRVPAKAHRLSTASTETTNRVQVHDEVVKLKEQVAAAEKAKAEALRELAETKVLLNETATKLDNADVIASESNPMESHTFSSMWTGEMDADWQAQLDAAMDQHMAATDTATESREIDRLQEELGAAKRQHESTCTDLGIAREEVDRLKVELQELVIANATVARQLGDTELANELAAKRVEEFSKELGISKEYLVKEHEERLRAERELVAAKEAAEERSTVQANAAGELEKLRVQLERAKEAEATLVVTSTELEDLKAELVSTKEAEAKLVATRAELDELRIQLERAKEAEATLVTTSAELEDLKAELVSAKEAEAKLVAARAELDALRHELVSANEAAAAKLLVTSTEVEGLKIELASTKEAEGRATKAVAEANLNLQRMKIDVEDAKVVAEKARAFTLQFEEMSLKLKKVTEHETILLASLASLKAELANAKSELATVKEEGDMTAADVAAEMEEVLSQLHADLEAATLGETKAKESVSGLSEALHQVTVEADEARAAAAAVREQAAREKKELEQAQAHIKTIESQLQAALMEMEAARASEAIALLEVKSFSECASTDLEAKVQGPEVPHTHEEYEALIRKVQEADDLANKRIAAAVAQVDAVRASEQEMLSKLDAAKSENESSQVAMRQAIHKAEIAEAAKSAVEGELRKWRAESEQRRKVAVTGMAQAAGSRAVGSPANGGDVTPLSRMVYMNSPTNGASQDSSPGQMGPSSILTPQERQSESLGQVLQFRYPSEEKKKKTLSTKIGSYFNKKVK